ncbi:MAG: hypothetical protein ACFFBD_28300, partial [Candidatus Hodarchaeota archaeon]
MILTQERGGLILAGLTHFGGYESFLKTQLKANLPGTYRRMLKLFSEVEEQLVTGRKLFDAIYALRNLKGHNQGMNFWLGQIGVKIESYRKEGTKQFKDFFKSLSIKESPIDRGHMVTITGFSPDNLKKVTIIGDETLSRLEYMYYHTADLNSDFITVFASSILDEIGHVPDNNVIRYISKIAEKKVKTNGRQIVVGTTKGITLLVKNPEKSAEVTFKAVLKGLSTELSNPRSDLSITIEKMLMDKSSKFILDFILSTGRKLGYIDLSEDS